MPRPIAHRPGCGFGLLVAGAVALLIAPGVAQAQPCSLAPATVIPLSLSRDHTKLLVPAAVDGKALLLVVDTGSQMTMLSAAALPDISQLHAHGMASGVGGRAAVQSGEVRGMQLGSLHGGVTAAVTDQQFRLGGQPVDGLLGMSVLGAYDVDFNLAGGQLRLFLPQGDCTHPSAFLHGVLPPIPERDDGEIEPRLEPRVTVTISGQSFSALLDTGSSGTALFHRAADKLGLTEEVLSHDPTARVAGVGAEIKPARLHVLDEIDVGDVGLRHVKVAVFAMDSHEDFDMILGQDFIRQSHLWLSNSSHSLILQVPPAPSPPLATDPAARP